VLRTGTEGRREVALTAARGLSARQRAVPAAAEAAVMVLPALVAGPAAGSALLAGLRLAGAPGGFGDQVSAPWWPSVACAALVAVSFVVSTAARGRAHPEGRRSLGGLYDRGFDVVLAAVAVLGCTQLLRYGSAPAQGQGVDALLVVVPALTAVAGTALLVRTLPLITGRLRRSLDRGRGLVLPVAASMADQRPLRSAGTVFVVGLAVTIGALAATYATAWSASQQDQADFAVGADLRATGTPVRATAQLQRLAGTSATTAVSRRTASIDGTTAGVLAVDSAAAPHLVRWREDLRRAPLTELLADIAPTSSLPEGLALPPSTERLTVVATAAATGGFRATVHVVPVLRDGLGLLHRLDDARFTTGDGPQRLTVEAGGPLGDGWTLQALELVYAPPRDVRRGEAIPTLTVDVATVTAVGADASEQLAASGGWASTSRLGPLARPRVSAAGSNEDALLRVVTSTGAGAAKATVVVRPPGYGAPSTSAGAAPLPVLANAAFAQQSGAEVGDVVEAELAGTRLEVLVAARAQEIPTAADGPYLLTDLAALSERLYAQAGAVTPAQELWASSAPGQDAAAAAAIGAALPQARVSVRQDVVAGLRADPLGSAGVGAAALGAVVAAVLALVGFASGAASVARERARELAFLEALGATPRQSAQVLATELGIAAAAALAAGLALGVVAARAVVPSVLLDRDAAVPFPAVQVPVPWLLLGLLAVAFVVPLALAAGGALIAVRRRGAAAPLRIGGAA